MSIPTPSTPPGDNPRLNAILAEYMKRKDAGQPIDRQALLKAYPDLADGLRSYFEAESMMGGVGGAAIAETIQPKAPPQSPNLRETVLPGASASDTASEFRSRSFGRYQLLRPLGEGAMGSVFLAHDSALDRKVALKIPKVDGKGSGEFLARFSREAKAAAGLKHPNVCSVYDTGEHDGTPYITMDFIDGVPLSRFVGSRQLRTADSILQMIATIAEAVEHAHNKGVVHRDLKPGNILIDADFKPHVTDFGLARRIGPDDEARLTQEGLLIGTPAYMAPEQVKGEQAKVGPRSDVYSLGVILFELLTSRLPFEGSVPEMLAQVLRDHPPSPSKFRKDLPDDVDDLCIKMLRKDPEKRFSSMAEVASAIGQLREKLRRAPLNKDDAARQQSPFEIEKSHIEQMLTKGQYTAAIKALEKLSREKTPGAKAAAEWARKKLPDVRAEEKSLSPSGLAALLQTAQQLFHKYDYPGVIQLLADVPSLRRTEVMEHLLEKAQSREAEAEQVLTDIKDRERSQHMDGIETLVKKFLKLKPGNTYAKRLWDALQSYSKTPVTRRQYRFDKGRLQSMPEPGFLRQWALLGSLVGVLVFLSVYAYVIIYLKSDNLTLAVHVNDEWLKKNGGELTLVVDRDTHTISTISPSGEAISVTVTLGNHTFSVKNGDTVVNNPKSFTIDRDGHQILSITPTDIELVASVHDDPGKGGTPGPDPPTPVPSPLLVKDQLKRLGLALHNYHDTHQTFPPANESPSTKLGEFTWRVQSLPYVGQALTYNQINFQEAWDSSANRAILAALPEPFDSPALSNEQRKRGLTVFLAPVAEGTVLGHKSASNLPGITDGTSNTILLVAAHPNAAQIWSSPGELRIDMNDPLKDLKGQTGGEFAVLMCDGSVKTLPDTIDPEIFRRMLVKNDGKVVDWGKIGAAAVEDVDSYPPLTTSQATGIVLKFVPALAKAGNPYYIGTHEVTQRQYRTIAGKNPSAFQDTAGAIGRAKVTGINTDDFPVESVGWVDAAEFCNALSLREQLPPYYVINAGVIEIKGGAGYRLPTYAEWFSATKNNGSITEPFDDYCWHKDNSGERTHQVGTKKANALGLFDIYGNVGELCWTTADKTKSQADGNLIPGGSWVHTPTACKGATTVWPNFKAHDVGFRVARDAVAVPIGTAVVPRSTAKLEDGALAGEKLSVSSIGADFSWCPAGTFRMGTETNSVSVELTRGFWLGQTEITQAQWRKVMGTEPWYKNPMTQSGDDYPASYISWDLAMAFCDRLTQQESVAGRLPPGMQYTLPTEAQWEYACRAGTSTKFSFGANITDLNDHAWWGGLSGGGNTALEQYPHKVGHKKSNNWGLFDIHGNLFEWCRDVKTESISGGVDPLVVSGGEDRVYRGGAWHIVAERCESGYRSGVKKNAAFHYSGFRITLTSKSENGHMAGDARKSSEYDVAGALTEKDDTNLVTENRSEPVARLTAPTLLSPIDGTFLGNRPQKNVMKWMPVPGATLYKIQIQFIIGPNGELGPACDFESKTNQFENDLNGNRPKRWRVGTASGSSTAWSDWWEFRYRP